MNDLQKQAPLLPVTTEETATQIAMTPINQLHRCRDLLVENVTKALSSRLNKIDKTLCDLSNNTDLKDLGQKKINLDELRIIRIKRDVIESTFKQQLTFETQKTINIIQNSNSLIGAAATNNTEAKEIGIDKLALIETEKRLMASSQYELIKMNKCLEHLFHLNKLSLENNPLSPSIICAVLYNICEQLETGAKIKLLLIKVFDKALTATLKTTYENITHTL